MEPKLIYKNIFLGFISWFIPFAISFLFYKPDGQLVVSYAIFKSAIMIVGTLCGSYLLFQYFKYVDKNFVKNGIIVGLSWFVLNIFLDVLILIPIMKTTFSNYFMSIGISYLSIPIISIAMAYLLREKIK